MRVSDEAGRRQDCLGGGGYMIVRGERGLEVGLGPGELDFSCGRCVRE